LGSLATFLVSCGEGFRGPDLPDRRRAGRFFVWRVEVGGWRVY